MAVMKSEHKAYGETLKEIKALVWKAVVSMAVIVAFIEVGAKFIIPILK